MKRAALILAALLLLLLLFAGYVRLTAAPIRDAYALDAPKQPKPGSELPVDAKVQHAIRRAKFDYFVYPVPRFGRKLFFIRALACAPSDLYLQFGIEGEAENTVVYRCAADGRLLWKAMISGGA